MPGSVFYQGASSSSLPVRDLELLGEEPYSSCSGSDDSSDESSEDVFEEESSGEEEGDDDAEEHQSNAKEPVEGDDAMAVVVSENQGKLDCQNRQVLEVDPCWSFEG